LKRKLNGAADRLTALHVQSHPPTYFRKGRRPGKIVSVTFEGNLEVGDPETLQELMKKGFGPAKAFGCGLMLVRRT